MRLVGGSLDLRTALLVLILAREAYVPLRALGSYYHASAEGLAAAQEVFAVLEAPCHTVVGALSLPVRCSWTGSPSATQTGPRLRWPISR